MSRENFCRHKMNYQGYVPACTEISASNFQILKRLGSGVQGETYIAQYQGQSACAKVFKSSKEMNHEVMMLTAAEVSSCSPKLLGTCNSLCMLLMELAPGITLEERLKLRPCRVSVHRIMIALGQAIENLHFSGLIHNDLKFDNIMVTNDDAHPHVTLIDFGWATFKGEAPYPHISSEAVKTFPHVSPKLAFGGESDCGSDNYSFGIILQRIANLYKCPLFAVLARMLTQQGGMMHSLQSLLQYIRDDYCKSCLHSCSCTDCRRQR